MEDPLPELSEAQFEEALRRAPASKAKGIEVLGPRDVINLPRAGRLELLELYRTAERHVAWPWQWLAAIITLLRTTDGNDR